MMYIYFNVISNEGNNINFLLPPLYYNNENGEIINLKVDDYSFNEFIEDDVYFPDKLKVLLSFVIHFPGRIVKNFKIRSPSNSYIITDLDNSHGWYGITIADVSEDYLPITSELNLAKKIYSLLDKGLKKGDVNFEESINLINEYKNNLAGLLTHIRKRHGEEYNLEETIVKKSGDERKWDFFAYNGDGLPITPIYRYDSKLGFFELDMNQDITLPNFEGTLEDLHQLNCAGLMSLYNVSIGLLGNSKLRHITSYLPFAKGIAFTFIENVKLDDEKELILVLDVKNRLKKEKKYVGKLFGDERNTISKIAENLITNYNKRSILMQNDLNSKIVNEILFKTFKGVVLNGRNY